MSTLGKGKYNSSEARKLGTKPVEPILNKTKKKLFSLNKYDEKTKDERKIG